MNSSFHSDVNHCDGLDVGGHCNGHQEVKPHRHPCHKKRLHRHCHSDHSMHSLMQSGSIHYLGGSGDLMDEYCSEQCQSCIDNCEECALDVSFGKKKSKP